MGRAPQRIARKVLVVRGRSGWASVLLGWVVVFLASRWVGGWPALPKACLFLAQRSTTRVPGSAKKSPRPLPPDLKVVSMQPADDSPLRLAASVSGAALIATLNGRGHRGACRFYSGAFFSQNYGHGFVVSLGERWCFHRSLDRLAVALPWQVCWRSASGEQVLLEHEGAFISQNPVSNGQATHA